MKRLLLIAASCMVGMSALAQKTQTVTTTKTTAETKTSYQFTQARKPQVLVEPWVFPMVAEIGEITSTAVRDSFYLSQDKVVRELNGDVENIYNYGIFLLTEKTNSDMIVASTYNLYTNPNPKRPIPNSIDGDYEDYFILVIKGFPAKFTNWRKATEKDYEWMRIENLKVGNNREVFTKVKE